MKNRLAALVQQLLAERSLAPARSSSGVTSSRSSDADDHRAVVGRDRLADAADRQAERHLVHLGADADVGQRRAARDELGVLGLEALRLGGRGEIRSPSRSAAAICAGALPAQFRRARRG